MFRTENGRSFQDVQVVAFISLFIITRINVIESVLVNDCGLSYKHRWEVSHTHTQSRCSGNEVFIAGFHFLVTSVSLKGK